jgi:hypothetical protein
MIKKLSQIQGIGIVEVMMAIGLLSVFIFVTVSYSEAINHKTLIGQKVGTRERMLSGVRNVAGMSAALRNSVRASLASGVGPINPDLYNCVAGTLLNACKNNEEYPLTLFSPTISVDAAGNAKGLLPITAFVGSLVPKRFDAFGVPCKEGNLECPFRVYTSFRAQCPPPPLPAVPPSMADPAFLELLKPMATCTIAEVINVTYVIDVDSAELAKDSNIVNSMGPLTGSVATSVKLIFGNDPR